jgi:ParB family transcriptional regulator, chromosome partitioning protein
VSESLNNETRRSNARKGGLGRGLGALIPSPSAEEFATASTDIPIDSIVPNPFQPRASIDSSRLNTLAESIRTHGVIQPLVVKRADTPGHFVLVAGERRWRAAKLAGLETVPVVIKDAAPQAMLEMALVENVVRADLAPLEEAAAYRQLVEEFGLTQAEVAARVGRSRVSITNILRLLTAPQAVQEALNMGEITEGHARALLGLPSAADQVAMLQSVVARAWSVRQTEDAVRRWLTNPKPVEDVDHRDHRDDRLEGQFRSALGTKVALRRDQSGRGGALTIHFYSDEELQALFERIVGDDVW